MTGRRFYRTMERIPAPAPGSLKPSCFHPCKAKHKTRGRKGCERGTTRNFLQSFPLCGAPPVVQSNRSPNLTCSKCFLPIGPFQTGGGPIFGMIQRACRTSALRKRTASEDFRGISRVFSGYFQGVFRVFVPMLCLGMPFYRPF